MRRAKTGTDIPGRINSGEEADSTTGSTIGKGANNYDEVNVTIY